MDKKVRLKKLTEQVTLKTASVHQIHFMDIPYTSEAQISKVCSPISIFSCLQTLIISI
jgi:hypothetical protein